MTTNYKVENAVNNAMTVGDLITMLSQYDKQTPVFFSCKYGDYGKGTDQCLPFSEIIERTTSHLKESGYSISGVEVNLDDTDEETYCEACDEYYDSVATCPKCKGKCVNEDGYELEDDDDDAQEILILN